MPNSATEKLSKILKLEAQMGYQDKAVTRGLASFAAAWLADAAKSSIDHAWAESVAEEMRSYSSATDMTTRKAALNALIHRLQSTVTTTATQKKAPAQQAARESPAPAPRAEVRRGAPPQARTVASQQSAPFGEPVVQIPAMPIAPPQDGRESTTATTPSAAPIRAPTRTANPVRPAEPASPLRNARTPTRRYSGVGLDAPVTNITGIGEFNALKFAKLGVKTIRDLLYFFPTRYDDYSTLKTINQLEYGEQVTIIGRVASTWKQRTKTGLIIVRVAIEDASGMIECSWFTSERFVDNMIKQFQVGREIVISGKVTEYLGKLVFQNPAHEPAEKEWVIGGNLVPVYRLTEGLQPLMVRRVMKRLVEYWPAQVTEFLPERLRREVGLIGIGDALREIHWPHDMIMQETARRRLAFDELFALQMAVLRQRQIWRSEPALPLVFDDHLLDALVVTLPYTLTNAQRRSILEIAADMRKPVAMHRLLQGDVGSGKTVVAALAMALAANAGAQSAIMAPTEILAEQHFESLKKLFDTMAEKGATTSIEIRLLTGSVKTAERQEIYEGLARGAIHVVTGTHALIQEAVTFRNLGFIVVDEQHRFGVSQRKALRQKGSEANPHMLVMTATPIPRTLALTMYGDLDNTVLDEMPPGRQPIETHWFAPVERERAYAFVENQVQRGRQAFIICPLVEESEKIEAKAAVEEHERLQHEIFPKLKLGLLHGRMKGDEKEKVMSAFARGEMNILVSTSVVEVGIDVPNATVMMIEGAERFGLSQLHQFRGRVGRGTYPSFCLLIADSSATVSDERLAAIVSTQDGFKLAEKDLEIRGPGEFFGTRQSGEPELKLVNVKDRDLLVIAREQGEKILEADPALETQEHRWLADQTVRFWAAHENRGDAS